MLPTRTITVELTEDEASAALIALETRTLAASWGSAITADDGARAEAKIAQALEED